MRSDVDTPALVALGTVASVIVVWALFISPEPTIELADPLHFVLELGVWTAAGVGLYAAGLSALGSAFVAVAFASGALNYAWG